MYRTNKANLISRLLIGCGAATLLVMAPAFAGGDAHKSASNTSSAEKPKIEVSQTAKDAWLDGKLESALLFNRQLNSFNIDTEVENGVARLSGAVESEIDKDLAGEVAKSVDGIDKVENMLTVDSEAASMAAQSDAYRLRSEWRQSIENATMTARVKSKLLINEHTHGLDINVDSIDGVVILTGSVGSDEEAELAEQIAANSEDVREVKNRLEVQGGQSS